MRSITKINSNFHYHACTKFNDGRIFVERIFMSKLQENFAFTFKSKNTKPSTFGQPTRLLLRILAFLNEIQ